MKLPEVLQSMINAEVGKINPQVLARAQSLLSESYRGEGGSKHIVSDADRLAYCAVRMPATFAAVCKVFGNLKDMQIKSLMDFGAGPGTVLWAAMEVFGKIDNSVLFEGDGNLLKIGEKFSKGGHLNAEWKHCDLNGDVPDLPEMDLGVFSYSYGELPGKKRIGLLEKCWKAVKQALVIIEPGTPQGYKNMLEARDFLLANGAFMKAPCPHGKPCPMKHGDWCHFAARLERSHVHQHIKEAYRGYEDEKYSFAILSKTAMPLPENRIVRPPKAHSGHVTMMLCSQKDVIENATVSRRMGPLYKQARDAEWGDPWPQ